MAKWIKDPVSSIQRLGLLLWGRFDPGPENFHMLWVWLEKKKRLLNFTENPDTIIERIIDFD